MADALMTSASELSVLVPQVWSSKYYDVLLAELPFSAVISKDYEGEIQALGDTVKISTVPQFDEAIELAEDARADASAVTVTQQSLVINKRVAKDFIITNKAMLQSLPVMDKLRDLAIYSINKKIQALIISLTIPNAAAPDHAIAFASGTTLALVDMLSGKELLDAQDVPMADRHQVMGSAQLNDLFNVAGFVSNDFVLTAGAMESGQLPASLLGFMLHFSSPIGNVVYQFHSSYFTMAAQKGISVTQYDLGVDGKRAVRVNVDTLIGLKQLDGLRVVSIG